MCAVNATSRSPDVIKGFPYTGMMQLRTARLCLDCEELHQSQHCPHCASEAFVYLSQWIAVEERRSQRRPPAKTTAEGSTAAQWMKRGAVGLAVVTAARLLWQSVRPAEKAEPATRKSDPPNEG
jgi:hypothetical protein